MEDEIRKYATELHRRRIGAGDRVPYERSVAEVGFLLSYSKGLSINDLRTNDFGLDIVSSDSSGREFCIASNHDASHWLVRNKPMYDNYVFVVPIDSSKFQVAGWLPGEEVCGAPIKGNFFVVSADNVIKLGDELDLLTGCPRIPCGENAVWDYDTVSWDCITCGRFRYDKELRDFELEPR